MKIQLFIKHCLDITLVILLAGCQLSASTPTLVIETDVHPTQGVNSPMPSPIPSISPTVTPLSEKQTRNSYTGCSAHTNSRTIGCGLDCFPGSG